LIILTYTYVGNRLSAVNDASGNAKGMKAGSSAYTYDANGNIITDGNNGAVLAYNYLNLPKTITIGAEAFTYDYDASGTKHKYAGDTLTLKYEGPFEYNGANAFKRLATSEGQAGIAKGDTIKFEYYIKDHLGNVQVVFDESGKIVQKTDYYPFGLEIDRNVPVTSQAARNYFNRYNFLGREFQVGTGYLDLKARFYNPLTGRFLAVDPVTKSQEQLSIYQYGWNNPIRYSDRNGDCPICDDFKKLFGGAKKYLSKNISIYGKSSVEVTGGSRVALKIGEGVGGDMNAGSMRLVKGEASYDTEEKGKASLDYISKSDEKGRKTMTVSHGVDYAAGVGGGAKMEYQLNSSGRASGEGSSEVQVAAALPLPTLAIYGKYETDKLTGQSSVQVGVNSSYKGGAGVVVDANFFDLGIKFRIPQNKER
jgi:RHS repeat-associated protein